MEDNLFLEHYRICTDDAGSREEMGRSGAAIVYKGVDVRTHEPVALQLIPLASIDPEAREQFEERARSAEKLDHVNIARVLAVGVEHDFIAVVSEFLDGETTDAWVVRHGPMAVDAVVRVGLQVVRALGAAAYHVLTHRALQPSNIVIVPGQAPDGGWPFVKLLNFGLAGAESHAPDAPGRTLAPSIAPQFASPEQLENRPLDFRSEIYSLGATMCFLLSGAAPVARGTGKGVRLGRLPGLRRAPRGLRHLLRAMLSEKPENRPQDPVALEAELRKYLTKLERRQSVLRKLGIPTMAALPRSSLTARPAVQILGGALAFAALVLVGAALAATLFPNARFFHFTRSPDKIGVPIGVAEPAKALVQNSPGANSATASRTPPVVAANQAASRPTDNTAQIPVFGPSAEPQPPAQGPNEDSFAGVSADSEAHASSLASNEAVTKPPVTTSSDSENPVASESHNRTRSRIASSRHSRSPDEFGGQTRTRSAREPYRAGWHRATVIGRTPDGRPILRLPSGRVVIVNPAAPDEDFSQPRRRVRIPPPNFDQSQAPWQPFVYPGGN
jgi:serine/threonine protein kinase